MFYHAGVASRIAEAKGAQFWKVVQQAQDEKWPRGTERRHFRGDNSQAAIDGLRARFPLGAPWAVRSLVLPGGLPSAAEFRAADWRAPGVLQFNDVVSRVTLWTGFGPWIAFKVADMLDAVLDTPVDFAGAVPGGLFDDPVKGAVWLRLTVLDGLPIDEPALLQTEYDTRTPETRRQIAAEVIPELLGELNRGKLYPMHRPEGPLKIQEVETVLCKWKSHLNGRYPMGKDTREILHGLTGWGGLATQLQAALATTTGSEL